MRRLLVYGLSLVGAAAGAVYAFNFGREISGWLLGALLGVNGFIFCGLVVGMSIDRLWPSKTASQSLGDNG
jgi:hypothetical protein